MKISEKPGHRVLSRVHWFLCSSLPAHVLVTKESRKRKSVAAVQLAEEEIIN